MEFLKQFPIFQEMTDDEFERLTRVAMKRSYEPKTFVFMEGEEREPVFFIQSGLVKPYKIDETGNEQVISLLRDGEMFPHVGFFDRSPIPQRLRCYNIRN